MHVLIDAPQVFLSTDSLLVHENETARFVCRAEGLPLPTVSWYHGDILMKDKVSGSQAQKELSFLPAKLSDRGDYTCRGINTAGMDEKKAKLDVFCKMDCTLL